MSEGTKRRLTAILAADVVGYSALRHGWIRPDQLWIDPIGHLPMDLPGLLSHIYQMRNGLILGGTRVYDWFLRHRAIARVHLTIDPVDFDDGLLIFSHQISRDPVDVFRQAGFKLCAEGLLNPIGTRYFELETGPA